MPQSLQAELRRRLDAIAAADRYRRRRVIAGAHAAQATVDGRACVNFCSNDYLGLAAHPALAEAMARSAGTHGVGAGASQLVTGHNAEHAALEAELADYVGRERALLFATGYAANTGTVAALMGKQDTIVADALNHASLIDGARLSGAAKRIYQHADAADASRHLQAIADGQKLLISDAVFSMDGDIAPLAALAAAAEAQGAWFMLDDAHGFGVLGGGRGTLFESGPQSPVPSPDIYIATLGKSLGAAGAFVAGDRDLIDYLVQAARSLIFSTASPPPVAAAARAGLRLAREEGWRREYLQALIQRFRKGAAQLGLPIGHAGVDVNPETRNSKLETAAPATPIQPLILGSEASALAVSDALLARGYLVAAIRPPTVAPGTSRLRITLTAAHTEDQIDGLLDALAGALARPAAAAVS